MAKKHVDLLIRALNTSNSYSEFLCDKIGYITGYYKDSPELIDDTIGIDTGEELKALIRKDIGYSTFGFEDSIYAEQGMTREEWVKTILIPLAEKL